VVILRAIYTSRAKSSDGPRESYVPACRGTIKNEDRRPSRRPYTNPGQRGFCNECDDEGPAYEECSSCQSAPNWVRGAFYYTGSSDDPGWRESLLYNLFPDDRAGELRYETWEYLCEVYGYMGFTRKCAIYMGLRKELRLWEVGITTLDQLLENLVIINDALRAKGLETFSKFELDSMRRYGNQYYWRCNH
jgi:hypothetical protein